MRRLVDLVTRIRAIDPPRATLRATLGAAARCIAEAHPNCAIFVLRLEASRPLPRLMVRAGHRPLSDTDLRELTRAARAAIAAPATLAHRQWTDETSAGRQLCADVGAVPNARQGDYAIALVGPPSPAEDGAFRGATVEFARQLLASGANLSGAGHARNQSLILRAKRDWESTADALPEIVGLLDERLRIVRVSRAAERWRLSSVRAAVGVQLHGLLHPGCASPGCELDQLIRDSARLRSGFGRSSFEHREPVLGRDLVITFVRADGAEDGPARRLAFSITDVTTVRVTQRALQALNAALEERVAERTAALEIVNDRLRAEVARRTMAEQSVRHSNAELAMLTEQLQNAQEEERRRIAQDLHDSVGQALSAIKYSLERVVVLQERAGQATGLEILDDSIARSQRLISEVRSIAMNLRPSHLDGLGAAAAVRSLCRDWASVYTDVSLEVDIAVSDAQIPSPLSTTLFRSVQESLNNVARHAAARHVHVAMRLDEATLVVTVRDDGAGFPASRGSVAALSPDYLGLRGLRERAERSGGRCVIQSDVGRGTTVRLEWPVPVAGVVGATSLSLN